MRVSLLIIIMHISIKNKYIRLVSFGKTDLSLEQEKTNICENFV